MKTPSNSVKGKPSVLPGSHQPQKLVEPQRGSLAHVAWQALGDLESAQKNKTAIKDPDRNWTDEFYDFAKVYAPVLAGALVVGALGAPLAVTAGFFLTAAMGANVFGEFVGRRTLSKATRSYCDQDVVWTLGDPDSPLNDAVLKPLKECAESSQTQKLSGQGVRPADICGVDPETLSKIAEANVNRGRLRLAATAYQPAVMAAVISMACFMGPAALLGPALPAAAAAFLGYSAIATHRRRASVEFAVKARRAEALNQLSEQNGGLLSDRLATQGTLKDAAVAADLKKEVVSIHLTPAPAAVTPKLTLGLSREPTAARAEPVSGSTKPKMG